MTDELKQWEYDRGYDKGKSDGARDFAEWLAIKRGFSKEWVEWHIDHWQKGGRMNKGLELCDKCDYFISVEEAYKQGKADAIEEFRKFSYCKVCEEKGWNIYCDYCRVCQAQEYIAEQLKEQR